MTTRTRGLVFLSVLTVALTLPAEMLLLQALVTPSPRHAVQSWVSGLDAASLARAASEIQSYPLSYRREIMRRLSPAERASVWRAHVTTYQHAHPELDATTVDLLAAASSVITPELFADPTDARRASVRVVAEQLVTEIGREEADYLLARLGPRDGTFASVEPLGLRLANKVRGLFMANAAAPDCNCSMTFGCYDYSTICRQEVACDWDGNWPMCGWFWSEPCDGLCSY